MIKRKISLSTLDKTSSNEFDNLWVYTNNQNQKNLNNEFRNRIEILDKELVFLDILERRTIFCNDDTKNEYLPKTYDPLLKGAYRGRIKKVFSPYLR